MAPLRYWYDQHRFNLSGAISLTLKEEIMMFEGRRWDRSRKLWSTPASVRSQKRLSEWGFEPLRDEGTIGYLLGLGKPPEPAPVDFFPVMGSYTPFPYQRDGGYWLSKRQRALLYDPVGIGKSLQALMWAAPSPRGVIVCPKPVIDQWIELIRDVELPWNVHYIRGPKSKRYTAFRRGSSDSEWHVINYERVVGRNQLEAPFRLIVDESTFVKNDKTARTKAVLDCGSVADGALALTGTPVINCPKDLWTTFRFVKEREKYEFWSWMQRYTGAFQTPYGWDFDGATHLDELGDEIKHFALRREWDDVGYQRPPVVEDTLHIAHDSEQDAKVAALREKLFELVRLGADVEGGDGYFTYQELRAASAVAKVPALAAWLKNHAEIGGGQTIIFSGFKEPLRQLAKLLPDLVTEYHGDLTDTLQQSNLQAFKAGSRHMLALTYDIGGMALNLQMADTVVLLDPPWTPKDMEQAIGRAVRQGQKAKHVLVLRCVSGHPIEARIFSALAYKTSITEAIRVLARPDSGGLTSGAGLANLGPNFAGGGFFGLQ